MLCTQASLFIMVCDSDLESYRFFSQLNQYKFLFSYCSFNNIYIYSLTTTTTTTKCSRMEAKKERQKIEMIQIKRLQVYLNFSFFWKEKIYSSSEFLVEKIKMIQSLEILTVQAMFFLLLAMLSHSNMEQNENWFYVAPFNPKVFKAFHEGYTLVLP